MPSSPNWPKPGSLSATDTWRLRRRTLEAMAALAAARARVAFIPLEHWRGQLGLPGDASDEQLAESRRIARHVDRAAERLPFDFKCLPRAIALAAMLRRRGIPHRAVIAARPAAARGGADDLHAWTEVGGTIVIGDLPGPWVVLFTLP